MPFWRRTDRRVESVGMPIGGAFLVRLDDKTHELTSLGRVSVDIVWLSANATIEGKGILDSMLLSPRVTAYFDNDGGASRATVSCMLFPQSGPAAGIAGPVVIACWDATSAAEAAVLTAHFLSVSVPVNPEPFIHPTWPTLQ